MSPHPSAEGRGSAGDWERSGGDVAVLTDRDNLEITRAEFKYIINQVSSSTSLSTTLSSLAAAT
jgi:hypothetical protein